MAALWEQAARVQVWDVIGAFFSWTDSAVELLLQAPNWDTLVIVLVVLAGLSESVGQSVVLFANRVRPARFLLSLAASALLYLLNFFIWVGSFWLLTSMMVDLPLPWKPLLIIAGVSQIPLLLGFLGFLPYAGQPILQLLYLWSYTMMVIYLRQIDAALVGSALLIVSLDLLIILLLRSLVGRVLNVFSRRILDVTAGTRLTFDVDEAVAQLAKATCHPPSSRDAA